MLHRPMTHALRLGVACLCGLAAPPGPARADIYLETGYLATGPVVDMAPGLLPTAYVVPTAFSTSYLPTSYVTTSAVMASESVLYPTSTTVVRRSLFRPRRYVERTYYNDPVVATSYLAPSTALLPTSYVASSGLLPTAYVTRSSLLPTTYVASSGLLPTAYVARSSLLPTSYVVADRVVATSATSSSYPCETTSSAPASPPAKAAAAPPAGDSGGAIVSRPSSEATGNERRPQGMVNSGEEAPSSAVTPPPAQVPAPPKPAPTNLQEPPPLDPGANPGGAGGTKPDDIKIKPPGETLPANPPGETTLRTVRRPGYDGRNILRGRVISAETRRPEEGVSVIISSLTKGYIDRPALTDADGEFKVSLPDGDWTVKVKMPSGSIFTVGRDFVTASNGRVTDSSGRNVAEFLITR